MRQRMSEGDPEPSPIEHYDRFVEYRRTGDRSVRNELVEHYTALVEFAVRR